MSYFLKSYSKHWLKNSRSYKQGEIHVWSMNAFLKDGKMWNQTFFYSSCKFLSMSGSAPLICVGETQGYVVKKPVSPCHSGASRDNRNTLLRRSPQLFQFKEQILQLCKPPNSVWYTPCQYKLSLSIRVTQGYVYTCICHWGAKGNISSKLLQY